MTLNILFFTITIKRRHMTLEEVVHYENIKKNRENIQERITTMFPNL
ncbi:YrzI family small protein [Bacillus sp. HMF5848]|nr:YrzI family small protein [Bacillus sp. HMF5848]RSK27951.1 YrzI family small protein [Bacillus sp. HMF5848]